MVKRNGDKVELGFGHKLAFPKGGGVELPGENIVRGTRHIWWPD